MVEVTRTYLQMTTVNELKPAVVVDERVRVDCVIECPSSFFRYLYREVGRNYHWVDRLSWTDDQICAYLNQSNVSLWVLYSAGAPAGYFELRQHKNGSVEIAYFGLLEEFTGRGLGKYLLTVAIERAWNISTKHIWVHTCTLDHPAALPNYLKRGFKLFKQEIYTVTL